MDPTILATFIFGFAINSFVDMLHTRAITKCVEKGEFHCDHCRIWDCPVGYYREQKEDEEQ